MKLETTDNSSSIQACDDVREFTEFYNKYEAFVYNTAIWFNLCHHSAKDVQQDVFMQLWRHKDSIDLVQDLKNYIFICTRNFCLNFLSKRKRHINLEILDTYENQFYFVEPLKEIEARQTYNRVKSTANKILPKQCKRVYQLAVENDVYYRDIAKALEITPSTVKNQKVRAIRLIKEILGSDIDCASKN